MNVFVFTERSFRRLFHLILILDLTFQHSALVDTSVLKGQNPFQLRGMSDGFHLSLNRLVDRKNGAFMNNSKVVQDFK